MKILPGKNGRVFVAVSGGMDSMALMYSLHLMKERELITDVEVIHINHGTRAENELEAELVKKSGNQLGLKVHIKKLDLSSDMPNFEFSARDARYAIFKEFLKKGDILYTAHHIDDSYEWSLMQSFKTSSYTPTLGIPLIRGQIARPFMCMTREQIKNFVKRERIRFFEDSSNRNLSYDRNYIRHTIIPNIRERFPSYLKHYVYRSNDLARKMGLSRISSENGTCRKLYDSLGGIALIHPSALSDFTSFESVILSTVWELSKSERGVLRTQIKKMIQAAKSGKSGPLTFSGEVLGFISPGVLYFISEEKLSGFQELDSKLLAKLKQTQVAHIPGADVQLLLNRWGNISREPFQHFPFLAFSWDGKISRMLGSIKRVHPLLPKTTQYAIEKGIWMNHLGKMIRSWDVSYYRRKKYKVLIP